MMNKSWRLVLIKSHSEGFQGNNTLALQTQRQSFGPESKKKKEYATPKLFVYFAWFVNSGIQNSAALAQWGGGDAFGN